MAFLDSKAKPRNHGREMPAELDLFGFGEEAEEFRFVAVEEPGLFRGNFFRSVGGAHTDDWIFAPEALDKLAKAARFSQNEARYFVCASDGAPVSAFERGRYFLRRHVVKKWPSKIQARARPAWVLSRRKSGARISMVRHISKRRERMRLPIRCSRESSRVGMTSFPLGRRVASPSWAGLS